MTWNRSTCTLYMPINYKTFSQYSAILTSDHYILPLILLSAPIPVSSYFLRSAHFSGNVEQGEASENHRMQSMKLRDYSGWGTNGTAGLWTICLPNLAHLLFENCLMHFLRLTRISFLATSLCQIYVRSIQTGPGVRVSHRGNRDVLGHRCVLARFRLQK